MNKILAILMTLSLMGCASMGKVLQGAGNGLSQSSQNRNVAQTCTGTTNFGVTTLNCR